MSHLVSIIMPAYNASSFIERSVASVVAQSYDNWELIIVNDASTDDTLDVLAKLASEDSRIRIIALETNSGAAVARNNAIEAALGRYIAFLDCDDLWYPEKLEKQIALMKRTGSSFCISSYDRKNEANEFLGVTKVPEKFGYSDYLNEAFIGCLTAIYDTDRIGKKLFDPIEIAEDFPYWLDILKHTDGIGIKQSLGCYLVRGQSLSSNKLQVARSMWRVLRQQEKLSFFQASYYLLRFGQHGVLNILRSKLNKLIKS